MTQQIARLADAAAELTAAAEGLLDCAAALRAAVEAAADE